MSECILVTRDQITHKLPWIKVHIGSQCNFLQILHHLDSFQNAASAKWKENEKREKEKKVLLWM